MENPKGQTCGRSFPLLELIFDLNLLWISRLKCAINIVQIFNENCRDLHRVVLLCWQHKNIQWQLSQRKTYNLGMRENGNQGRKKDVIAIFPDLTEMTLVNMSPVDIIVDPKSETVLWRVPYVTRVAFSQFFKSLMILLDFFSDEHAHIGRSYGHQRIDAATRSASANDGTQPSRPFCSVFGTQWITISSPACSLQNIGGIESGILFFLLHFLNK